MGTIPLPALSVKPPEQPDPLGGMQKILALKSILGQQQMQNIDLQTAQQGQRDQQATTQALREWDGQNPNDLPHLILQNGGSSNAVLNAQSKLIDMRQKAATLDETTLKNQQTQNDQYRGRILSVVNAPEDQKQSLWAAEVAKERQAGTQLSPNINDQYPGDDVATQYANHFALGSVLAKEAIDDKTATARQQQAGAAVQQANTAAARLGGEQNPASLLYKPTDASVALGTAPGAGQIQQSAITQAGLKAGAEAQARQPIDVQTEVQKQAALQKQNPAALANVRPNLIAPATAAFDKAGQDYATAYQSAQNMEDFINEAKSGNKEAVKIVPLQGALEITTAQGVHRINRTEVDQYGGAGNLYDKLAGGIGGVITGKNITDSVLNDMDALQKTVSQNATNLHANRVATINKSYGSQFEPMQFGNSAASGQALPKGFGAVIDKATAQRFYDAAGRDPNKARQLAIQSGWKVQ